VTAYDQNSHRKDYSLDSSGRITKVTEYNIDQGLYNNVVYSYNTSYSYDSADQLREIVDTYGNNFSLSYDSLGRRTRIRDPDIGEINYTYDLVGNLISQASGGGNLITGDGFNREYNTLNQLIRIRNGSSATSPILEQYTYDPFGQRIKIWKNDSAGTVIYTPFRELMQVRNSSGIYNFSYIYDGSTLVATVNPDGSKYFYHPDQLGSTTLITSSTGSIVEKTFYEPFGDITSGGTSEVKLYTGQYDDKNTGQDYYGARYYKPSMGKFIQPDSLITNTYDPQQLNRYAYVRNNPYKYIDPKGQQEVILPYDQILKFPFENFFPDLFPVGNTVDITIIVNNPDTSSVNSNKWSDWKYEKFRDDSFKWIRESDKEIETWEEDEPHSGSDKPHINNRIYDKEKLNDVDKWKQNRESGKKPESSPRSGPDDHQPIKSGKNNPDAYRKQETSSKTNSLLALIRKLIKISNTPKTVKI
jgi:RHS repeat-associated protein